MDKQQFLALVQQMAGQRIAGRDEVLQAYDAGAGIQSPRPTAIDTMKDKVGFLRNLTIAQVLYSIGGLIVLLGILILVLQNWNDLNAIARIVIALGSSIAFYVSAAFLLKDDATKGLAHVFFLLSFILLPIGMAVFFYETGFNMEGYAIHWIISGLMLLAAFASFLVYRSSMFVLFGMFAATWLYYSVIAKIVDDLGFDSFNIWAYITMALGLGYIFMGYHFDNNTSRKGLANVMYFTGLVALLGAALSLGGAWDVIYVGMVFGVIMLSVYIKNTIFLRVGAIFLMIYVIKITAEYFGDSLGWPFALVLAGLALIGVGYLAHYINKKYISSPEVA